MIFESTEKFLQGHNILFGDLPEAIKLASISDKIKFEIAQVEKFGFFGGSNNFNAFYPSLTAEDLKPKSEDYVTPIFRALSETRVRPYFPVNFGKNDVLKPSMNKLVGQTVYPNHESEVGNQLGVVTDVVWQESQSLTKDGKKIIIPAGINTQLKIDGKSNPKIARGLTADPPEIHSTSVTVQFAWEQSHPELTRDEFFHKVGTYDAKGSLIERYATKILAYHEISFVSHGADPYAQMIKDGKIINPEFADGQSFSVDKANKKSYHFFDYKDLFEEAESFSAHRAIPDNPKDNQNPNKMNDELKQILEALGVAIPVAPNEIKFSEVLTSVKGIKTAADSVAELTSTTDKLKVAETLVNTLNGTVVTLTQERNTARTELADAIGDIRNEVTRLYSLAVEKPETSMTELISKADSKACKAFKETFSKQAEEKFKGSCQDCGSENVSRMSSKKEEDPETGKGKFKIKTDAEIAEEYVSATRGGASFVHGADPVKK